MSKLFKAQIVVELEEIPPFGSTPLREWELWCATRDIRPLASSRRGWPSFINTYVRDASHIVYLDGEKVGFLFPGDSYYIDPPGGGRKHVYIDPEGGALWGINGDPSHRRSRHGGRPRPTYRKS